MVGQGPAVLAEVQDRWAFLIFFISSILSSFSNASSLGRRLDILKYCGLGPYNPMVQDAGAGRMGCFFLFFFFHLVYPIFFF